MALSLTAEKKELLKIFKIEEQYVIPAYQRPYSWEYDHCFQLYNDLVESFETGDEYFIGNIVIFKSAKNNGILEVIDGQQRLTTLLLLIKVLSLLFPELLVLKQIIEITDWSGNTSGLRIKTEIFEANDQNEFENVLNYRYEDLLSRLKDCQDKKGKIIEKKCRSRFETNFMYFYDWITFYKKKTSNFDKFVEHLLTKVYLLPIELAGNSSEETNEKALVIFETINNRGMNLEDADIFKAKLYHKAEKIKEKDIFIELWGEFKDRCDNLNLQIDDIFRYYSHIIRGNEKITSSEINLRRFFTIEKYSPFKLKKYKEVLDDLFRVVEVLEFINIERTKETELSKWIQLIEAYTNRYPKLALVVYLYHHMNDIKIDYTLLESIVRYTYYYGSTTKVKFGIYTIIKNISSGISVDSYYRSDIDVEYFNYLGNLKYGYALLSFYIGKDKALQAYSIDKIIHLKDKKYLYNWNDKEIDESVNTLGNFVVLDIPKKNISFSKRAKYYESSSIKEVQHLFDNINYIELKERDLRMKNKLVDFFKGDA